MIMGGWVQSSLSEVFCLSKGSVGQWDRDTRDNAEDDNMVFASD